MANGRTVKERIARLEECMLNMGRGFDEIKAGIERLNDKIDAKLAAQDAAIGKQAEELENVKTDFAGWKGKLTLLGAIAVLGIPLIVSLLVAFLT